jgi:hypothetical protein
MFGMDAALRRPVGAARRPCHFNQSAPSAREMAWPISLAVFCFPNFRYSLPFSACQHVRVSAFAPDIFAFAFSLSGAHSSHHGERKPPDIVQRLCH